MAGEIKSKQQVQKQEEKTTNFFLRGTIQNSPTGDKRFTVEIPIVYLLKGATTADYPTAQTSESLKEAKYFKWFTLLNPY